MSNSIQMNHPAPPPRLQKKGSEIGDWTVGVLATVTSLQCVRIYFESAHALKRLNSISSAQNFKLCQLIKHQRNLEAFISAVFAGAVLISQSSPTLQKIFFIHGLMMGFLSYEFHKQLPKFCNPSNVPYEPLTEVLQKEIDRILEEWGPKPALGMGRFVTPPSHYGWPASAKGYAADDVLGNVLPGLILGAGGLLAAGARGAASGLSWTAESAMGAVPRLPVLGY